MFARDRSAIRRSSGEGCGQDNSHGSDLPRQILQACAQLASAGVGPYRAAVSTIVPSGFLWVAGTGFASGVCLAIANGMWSHNEDDCPGSFIEEQSWVGEPPPDMSCVAIGMAATQPV
jgi:hypothetical protein